MLIIDVESYNAGRESLVIIQVIDKGVGISSEDQKNLF